MKQLLHGTNKTAIQNLLDLNLLDIANIYKLKSIQSKQTLSRTPYMVDSIESICKQVPSINKYIWKHLLNKNDGLTAAILS